MTPVWAGADSRTGNGAGYDAIRYLVDSLIPCGYPADSHWISIVSSVESVFPMFQSVMVFEKIRDDDFLQSFPIDRKYTAAARRSRFSLT